MNEYFQENKRSLFILAGLFFILIVVLYVVLLRPLIADLSSKEKAISSAKDEIHILEKKLENFELETADMDIEQLKLENKIPMKRELDEYILSLQQLEVTTNSKIEKIEFMYDSNLDDVEEETENIEDNEETVQEVENLESEDEENAEEIQIDPVILDEKPEELQIITVKVTAASPEFEDFIELLKAIENQERISIVSKLKFIKPTEYDLYFEDLPTAIAFEAELTTFYYAE